jgi:DNA-binding transcriptional ArsR family regulator
MTLKVARLPHSPGVLSLDDSQMIARFFQVLADPTRVRMIKALADAEWCVSDLTDALGMDQPAVSHQLKYLRDLGLVRWTKNGRHVYYSLSDTHLRDILISSIAHLECQSAAEASAVASAAAAKV